MPLQGWTLVPPEEGEDLPPWQRTIDVVLGCESRVPPALADGCGLPGHVGCATLYGLLAAIYRHKGRTNLCPEWLAKAAVRELLLNDQDPPLRFTNPAERADAVTRLRLGERITRARAAVIMVRAFALPQLAPREVGRTFKDLAPTHWAGPSVYGAVSVGVLAGYGNDTFQPERCIEGEHLDGFAAKAAAPPGAPAWDRGGFDPRVEWQRVVPRDLRAYSSSKLTNAGILAAAPSASSLSAEEDGAARAGQGGAAAVVEYLDVEQRPRYADRLDKVVDGKGEEKDVLRTFCNVYAHDYAQLLGAYLPRVWWKGSNEGFALTPDEALGKASGDEQTAEMKANRLYAWLQAVGHRFGWWLEGSVWKGDGRNDEAGEPLATKKSGFEVDGGLLSRAQHLADAGFVVVIVARAFSDECSGHVAAVVPAQGDEIGWNAAAPLEGWHWELGPRPGVIERLAGSIADPQRTPPVQSQAGSPVKRWQSLSPWKDDRFLVGSADGAWRRRVQVWAHRPPAAAIHDAAPAGSSAPPMIVQYAQLDPGCPDFSEGRLLALIPSERPIPDSAVENALKRLAAVTDGTVGTIQDAGVGALLDKGVELTYMEARTVLSSLRSGQSLARSFQSAKNIGRMNFSLADLPSNFLQSMVVDVVIDLLVPMPARVESTGLAVVSTASGVGLQLILRFAGLSAGYASGGGALVSLWISSTQAAMAELSERYLICVGDQAIVGPVIAAQGFQAAVRDRSLETARSAYEGLISDYYDLLLRHEKISAAQYEAHRHALDAFWRKLVPLLQP